MVGALTGFVRQPMHDVVRHGDDPEDVIWALKGGSFEVKRGEVLVTLPALGMHYRPAPRDR